MRAAVLTRWHACRLSSFVEQITEQHFVGADEKFAVKTAGIKEFDPLRDGPLRYLGYSNECGWVHNLMTPPHGCQTRHERNRLYPLHLNAHCTSRGQPC